IHRLPRAAEEVLYPAMEDYALDIVLGRGPGARSVRLSIPRFTLVGATTRYAMLSPPLRDRFGAVYRLDFYDEPAIAAIILRNAGILKVPIDDNGAEEIARRSRGTPRVANRLLRRVRDYAQVRADGSINAAVAGEALLRLDVDDLGLDDVDHKVLRTIIEKYDGGPVGIETIAASISEEADTIMDVYEPYLMQVGFLQRTPRGRIATRHAYAHLGLEAPRSAQAMLGIRTRGITLREITDEAEREEAEQLYVETIVPYDYFDVPVVDWTWPSPSRIRKSHREWLERGTLVALELE